LNAKYRKQQLLTMLLSAAQNKKDTTSVVSR